MGLASKLMAAGPAPGAYGAPPPQQGGYGAPPPQGQGYGGQPSAPPFPGSSAPPSQYGQGQQPGQYGAPQGQAPGQYGQQLGQQPGGVKPGQYGAPQGQAPGQYGAPQGQGQAPGQFGQAPGQQPGQYGQQPGQQPGQYGQQPGGQQPGQYGQPGGQQQPGQYGQQPGMGAPPGQYGQQPGMGPPPGQFGQQPGMGGPGQGTFDANTIRNKLQQTIQTNRLQALYPQQVLEQLVQRVAATDLAGFGAKWRIPKEITLDLVALALYDVILYCDDSGSMAFEENGERIDDLKMIIGRTADAATLFDHDGISVRFMNSQTEGNNIRSSAEANNLLSQIKFSGTTPLGTSLDRKVLQPLVVGPARSQQLRKPVLVIAITDGEPTGESRDCVKQVILQAKNFLQNSPLGPGAVAFQFAQVGKDTGAQAFLGALDTDPQVGKQIDCTSYFEFEAEEFKRKGIDLSPELWLVKLLVGSIDPSYDEQDERH